MSANDSSTVMSNNAGSNATSNASTITNNTGQRQTPRNNSRNTTGTYRNNNTGNRNNNNNRIQGHNDFKGETPAMNGHVFQVHAEQKKRGQFQDTLDALKVYASTAYRKDINHLTRLFSELKTPEVPRPEEPVKIEQKDSDGNIKTVITKFSETVFQERVKLWIKDESSLRATTQSLYNIVWGQCSKLMQNKLKAVANFQDTENAGDVTTLLKDIRGISHQLETNTSVYDSLDEAKRLYYAYKQGEDETNDKHLKNFKNLVEVIEHFGGDIFQDQALIKHEMAKDKEQGLSPKTNSEYDLIVRNKMMAIGFLKRANTRKYEILMSNIRDQFAFNIDVYPTTLNSAYELLENHSSVRRSRPPNERINNYAGGRGRGGGRGTGRGRGGQNPPITGLQYAQNTEVVPGSDGRCVARITCWKCNKRGHFADFCPETSESTGVQQHNDAEEIDNNTQASTIEEALQQNIIAEVLSDEDSDDDSVTVHFQYLQGANYIRSTDKDANSNILLDTGSTCSVF